jgi:hypothetical protein
MPSLESLEAAAASLQLEAVRQDSSLRVRLNRLNLLLADWWLDFSGEDGRMRAKLRAASLSDWHLRLLLLASITPMLGYFLAHPNRSGVPALLFIAAAVIPYGVLRAMVWRLQSRLMRRASELESLAA